VAVDEHLGDLAGVGAHVVQRLRPVRVPRGVPEIDDVLVGEEVDQGAGDGQPAEAAVEDAYRSVIHYFARSIRSR
jgi:hypothetical protein